MKHTHRKLKSTGTVEYNIYIADFTYEYIPKSYLTPKYQEVNLTDIYMVDEDGETIKIKEDDVPKNDLEWLLDKAQQQGLENLNP